MAGKPVQRMAFALIEAKGGEPWVLEQVAQGHGYRTIAKELGVSLTMFVGWATHTDARRQMLRQARENAAQTLAEQALEIADEADPLTERVARLRIDTRKWIASKWAPDTYGDNKGPVVQISINDMHLKAVRSSEVIEVDQEGVVKPSIDRS